jgi:hypothetical protein
LGGAGVAFLTTVAGFLAVAFFGAAFFDGEADLAATVVDLPAPAGRLGAAFFDTTFLVVGAVRLASGVGRLVAGFFGATFLDREADFLAAAVVFLAAAAGFFGAGAADLFAAVTSISFNLGPTVGPVTS